jgi:hypothetical protein
MLLPALLFCVLALDATSNASRPEQYPWLRTTDPAIAAAIHHGMTRSGTFRALAYRLRDLGAIVYFVRRSALPRRVQAALWPPLRTASGTRYVHVAVRPETRGNRLVSVLAHELHHALEALTEVCSSEVETGAAIFPVLRFRSGPGVTETRGAMKTEDRVGDELAKRISGKHTAIAGTEPVTSGGPCAKLPLLPHSSSVPPLH